MCARTDSASDAALINGLGHLRAIGLDAWDEAQAHNGMTMGSVAQIGGHDWQRVGGLLTTGDFGGSLAGEDAYIVMARSDGTIARGKEKLGNWGVGKRKLHSSRQLRKESNPRRG